MLTKKKKLSKREIKEDKLVTTYYKVYNYFNENKNRIGIYAGGLLVVIAAIYFYMNNKAENNNQAGIQLSRVMAYMMPEHTWKQLKDGRELIL